MNKISNIKDYIVSIQLLDRYSNNHRNTSPLVLHTNIIIQFIHVVFVYKKAYIHHFKKYKCLRQMQFFHWD